MDHDAPKWLYDEREALWNEILEAFAKVDRKGGVSWSETRAIDNGRSDEERVRARKADRERSWQDLVDDRSWDPATVLGGWRFLDAIGFRYYLPAAMLRGIRREPDGGLAGHLMPRDPRNFKRERWVALNPRQRACIRRYLLLCLSWDEHHARKRFAEDGEREAEMQRIQAAREVALSYWPAQGSPR